MTVVSSVLLMPFARRKKNNYEHISKLVLSKLVTVMQKFARRIVLERHKCLSRPDYKTKTNSGQLFIPNELGSVLVGCSGGHSKQWYGLADMFA